MRMPPYLSVYGFAMAAVALLLVPTGIVFHLPPVLNSTGVAHAPDHPSTPTHSRSVVPSSENSPSGPLYAAERSLAQGAGPAYGRPTSCAEEGSSAHCAPTKTSAPLATPPGAVGWREVYPAVPSPRSDEVLVIDTKDNVTLLFGGVSAQGIYLGDTWEFHSASACWPYSSACSFFTNTGPPGGYWQELNGTVSPSPRANASATYDQMDNEVLLFGGEGPGGTALNDTWTFQDGNWTEVNSVASPSARFAAAISGGSDGRAVWGSPTGPVVLFGGETANGRMLGDTWQFSSGQWVNVTPARSPPPRAFSSLLWTSAPSFALFGGLGSNHVVLGDLWIWTSDPLGTCGASGLPTVFCVWHNVTANFTGNLPSPRYGMAYSSNGGKLYGGTGPGGELYGDLWDFTNLGGSGTLTNMSKSDILVNRPPPPRIGSSLCVPSAIYPGGYETMEIYLWGGKSPSGEALGDSWTLELVNFGNNSTTEYWWINMTSSYQLPQGPPPVTGMSMVYDDADQEVVLFGGFSDEIDTLVPQGPLNDTWTYSNGVWTNVTSYPSPSARWDASMAYDPADSDVVLYGGISGTADPAYTNDVALGDTWTFAAGSWTDISQMVTVNDSSQPFFEQLGMLPRGGASLAWDPQDQGLLLFGGWDSLTGHCIYMVTILLKPCGEAGGTWLFSNDTWTRLTASGPSNRSNAGMVWDYADNYMVLFGGLNGQDFYGLRSGLNLGFLDDTWKFTNDTWTQLNPTTPPPLVGAPQLAYDQNDHEVILFGSGAPYPTLWPAFPGDLPSTVNNGTNATWAFRAGQWTNLSAALSEAPPISNDGAMVFDQADNTIVYVTGDTPPYIASAAPIPSGYPYWTTVVPYNCYPTAESIQLFPVSGGYCWGTTWTFGPPPLRALATATPAQGLSPLTVHFTGAAVEGTGPYRYLWNFGDASPESTAQNPTHTYNATAIFTATLTVTDKNDTNASARLEISTLCPNSGNFVCVVSHYGGYFLHGISVQDTLGVYAEDNNQSATSVTGTIGGATYTFSAPKGTNGAWTVSIDMGQLAPRSVLDVTATFPGGGTLSENYNLGIIDTPSWLTDFLGGGPTNARGPGGKAPTPHPDASSSSGGKWYAMYGLGREVDLLQLLNAFNVTVPPFINTTNGSFKVLPDFGLYVNYLSNGYITLGGFVSGTYKTHPPPSPFPSDDDPFNDMPQSGPSNNAASSETFSIALRLDVTGTWKVNGTTDSVDFVYFNVSLQVKGSLSFVVPIEGYAPPQNGVPGVGIYVTITVKTNLSFTFVFAPNTSRSDDILGLGIMLKAFIFGIGLTLEVVLTAAVAIASVSGGGDVGITAQFTVSNNQMYLSKFVLSGQLFMSATFGPFGYTLMLYSGIIWQWTPSGLVPIQRPAAHPAPKTIVSLLPRYWNVTGYDSPVWANGSWSGPALHDVFPYTSLSLAPSADGASFLYMTDAVNKSEAVGTSIEGYDLNTATRTLSSLPPPPSAATQVLLHPLLQNLSNGTELGLWQAIVPAQIQGGPAGIRTAALQADYYNATTGAWSTPSNLTQTGVAQSFVSAPCGGGAEVAALIGPSFGAPGQYVQLWRLSSTGSSLVTNRTVASVEALQGLDCTTGDVSYLTPSGAQGLLNLASGSVIPIPLDVGYHAASLGAVRNASGTFALLEISSSGERVTVFDAGSGSAILSRDLPGNPVSVQVVGFNGAFYGVIGYRYGYTIENLSDGRLQTPFTYTGDIASLSGVEQGSYLIVTTLVNTGTSSRPLLNLLVNDVPLIQVSAPVVTPNPAGPGATVNITATASSPTPVTVTWNGLPVGCTAGTAGTYSLTCPNPTPGSYTISLTAMDADLHTVTGPGVVLRVLAPTSSSSSAGGLWVDRPLATLGTVDPSFPTTLLVEAGGGKGPYTYNWSGLPSGCLSQNASRISCSPTTPGTYAISVTVRDTAGRSVLSPAIPLVVFPDPSVALAIGSSPVAGQPFLLTGIVSGGMAPYLISWPQLPTGCLATNANPVHCTLAAGSYPVSLEVRDAFGVPAFENTTLVVAKTPSGTGTPTGSGGGSGTGNSLWEIILLGVAIAAAAGILFLAYWRWRPGKGLAPPSSPPSPAVTQPTAPSPPPTFSVPPPPPPGVPPT